MIYGANGTVQEAVAATPAPVPIYSNLRLQNIEAEGVIMMMLGDDRPMAAVALIPTQVDALIQALTEHLENLEHRIIRPIEGTTGGADA